MDTSRFDQIARLLATRRTRRATLGAAGIAATIPLFRRAAAQDATPAAPTAFDPSDPHPGSDALTKTEFLFVQPFSGGAWAPKEGEEGTYTLTLSGAAANTVYFSDRPERVFGVTPTQRFIDGLGFTPDNPPNAAVVARRDGSDEQEILVVELLNPTYDATSAVLTYDARVLADYGEHGLAHAAQRQADYELGETFAEGGLFIDDCKDVAYSCYGFNSGRHYGDVWVGECFDWTNEGPDEPFCKPCHDPAGYCASAYPNDCSQRIQVEGGAWITINTCTAG